MRFSELQLEPSLFSAIQKLNYENLTPIQEASFSLIRSGKDISGLAQTGTGKTAAFLIPLMDRILKAKNQQTENSFNTWKAQDFILILVPTRELAEQVQENVEKLSTDSGLKGFAIYGGTSYDKQKEAVQNGLDFIVATPGRLIDLYKEHIVDLKQVRAVVFDEADRMFDMGFKDDMKFILGRIPRERQFLVYSATLNFDVINTAYQFGAEPIEIDVSRDQAKADNVKDEIFHVGENEKPMYLLSIIKKYSPKQVIIFSNFKHSVERISHFLTSNGIPAMGISSLLTQAQRNRVIEQFKAENEKNILVATDVAARGLDIKGVDLVINYELPSDAESYVHRIGRTGRAGAMGTAYSLVCDKDVDSLKRIEEYLKHKLEIGWLDDQDLIKDFKPLSREHFQDRDSFQKDRPPQKRFQKNTRHGGERSDFKREHKRPHHRGDQEFKGDKKFQKDNRSQFKRESPPSQAPKNHTKSEQNFKKKPFNKHKHKNFKAKPYPQSKQTQAPKQKGIVAKVSSFFKKLFAD
jgi:superfamily II DNA/RNA helicase